MLSVYIRSFYWPHSWPLAAVGQFHDARGWRASIADLRVRERHRLALLLASAAPICKGLQLWITPSGAKLWNLAYRFDGKQRKLAIGPYPRVAVKDARTRRDEAKRQLDDGLDPSQQKRPFGQGGQKSDLKQLHPGLSAPGRLCASPWRQRPKDAGYA